MRKRNSNRLARYLQVTCVLLFITVACCQPITAQNTGRIRFRDYSPVENIDSLEKVVATLKSNPAKYMTGLARLERSRQRFASEIFGSSLPLLDSLSVKYKRADARAAYFFFASDYEKVKKKNRIKALQHLNKALELFTQQEDTSGMIRSYFYLELLQIDDFGRPTGDVQMAKNYMNKIAALAKESDWVEDKLYNLFAQERYYYQFHENEANALLSIAQQTLDTIDAHPDLYYLKPERLNHLAIAYDLKENYRKALDLYFECLKLCKDGWYIPKFIYLYNIGNEYSVLDEPAKAEEYYKESYELMKLHNSTAAEERNVVFNIAVSQTNQKKYEEASQNFMLADSLDEIDKSETRSSDFFDMQVKYETEKKEQANKTLQKEKQTYETGILASFIMLGIISLLLFHLYRKNKQLDAYAHFRDQIFGIISHDLRSPINALEGLSKQATYLMKRGETHKLELVGQKIDASVLQMNSLLNNLLAWAISQQTKTDMHIQKLPLRHVVSEILLLYADVVSAKNITININIDDRLVLRADKNGLAVVIRNLIDNAIKYSDGGQVTIQAEEEGDQIIVRVSNDAVITCTDTIIRMQNQLKGIQARHVHTTSGFGLQLIAYFIRLHKGSVTLKSNSREGTVLSVTLPA